jgi:hypothetical protein
MIGLFPCKFDPGNRLKSVITKFRKGKAIPVTVLGGP